MCQEIFRTLMSKYTPMKNRYLVLRWQEIFLNSYYYGSCMLQLFVCKVQGCCFRNFEKWKVFLWSSQMVIHLSVFWQGSLENFLLHEWQSKGFSYECILTQEFGKFLVTWVAAQWFLIWVYSDMFIQMWEFGKFLVTLGAVKWFFISVYYDLGVCKNFSSHE